MSSILAIHVPESCEWLNDADAAISERPVAQVSISMKRLLKKIWAKSLTVLGDIRISKLPPFLYYDTVDYKVKGDTIERIQKIL